MQKATRKEWLGLIVLIFPTLVVSMDMTVTYLALPVLSTALHPRSAELLWITDIFGFMEAGLLIVMGTLGDRIGLRRLLLTGGAVFAAASALAAFSPSAFWLIIARGLMGIAGATLLPTVLSLIRNLFVDDRERTFALGLYTTCFSTGIMLGPIFGGLLLSHFWWGAIFLMPAPLVLMLLLLAPLLLPECKDAEAKNLDLASAVLLIAATLLLIYGLKQVAQNGFSALMVLFIVVGALLVWPFIRRQRRLSRPFIDLSLFEKPAFSVALATLFVALFTWAGMFLFVGQYLQSVVGLSSFAAGLWMLPGAVGGSTLCMLAPAALRYIRRNRLIVIGLLIQGLGVGLLALLGLHSLVLLAVGAALMSGGSGVVVTLGIDMVISSAPPQKAGAAAGISETSTAFGGSLGVALLGSLWTAIYRKGMAGQPSALRDTIGSAVAEAARRHDPAVMAQAREAFLHALHTTSVAAVLVISLTAVFAVVKIPRTLPPNQFQTDDPAAI
jgi:DHA2 family multidrug resistance protein-like MFS transporter